jgi:hypothetical protein
MGTQRKGEEDFFCIVHAQDTIVVLEIMFFLLSNSLIFNMSLKRSQKKELMFTSNTRLPYPFEYGGNIIYTNDLEVGLFSEVLF